MQKEICVQHNKNILLREYMKNDVSMYMYTYMYVTHPSRGVTLKQEKNHLAT